MNNFKDIHIGSLIKKRVLECDIDTLRICNFFNINKILLDEMYDSKSLDATIILKWSKLLEYDFFRIYSQHLILYSPPSKLNSNSLIQKKSSLPQFRKNIYTKEIIYFIIELIDKNLKTKNEIIKQYKIPKTTLYKWIAKYKTNDFHENNY